MQPETSPDYAQSSPPTILLLSIIFGGCHYQITKLSARKIVSGDGASKLQMSVPCRGRTCPEIVKGNRINKNHIDPLLSTEEPLKCSLRESSGFVAGFAQGQEASGGKLLVREQALDASRAHRNPSSSLQRQGSCQIHLHGLYTDPPKCRRAPVHMPSRKSKCKQ